MPVSRNQQKDEKTITVPELAIVIVVVAIWIVITPLIFRLLRHAVFSA